MPRLVLAACLSLLVLVPAAEAKTKGVFWQQSAGAVDRVWDQIGFIPTNAIQGPGDPPQTVRSGTTTYKVAWINSLYSRRTTKALLKEIHRYSEDHGAYTDAPLKGKWRRRFDVMVDLGRDADVLVVARGNPVCESGLSRAQARGIARGTITQWSEVGAPGLGAIKRRLIGERAFAQPRFGAQGKPGRSVVRADGGVSEAAGGDTSIAAITAWSRVGNNSAVCAVPIDGVAPTDVSVFRREYKPAYPIQYVMHRKRRTDREGRAMVKAYVAFLKSEKAANLFRGAGILLVADGEPSATSGPGGGGGGAYGPVPTTDHAGRPITATRDDAAAAQAMSGRRLQAGSQRLVFDADGSFRELTIEEDGSCSGAIDAGWAILEAWTYPEYGGGIVARVRAIHPDYEALHEIALPGDEPGTAYVNGQPHVDDPSLSRDCV